jgi:hypothetical protein
MMRTERTGKELEFGICGWYASFTPVCFFPLFSRLKKRNFLMSADN